MQTTDGGRTFWFGCQRSTKSGKPTGNEFKRCPHEKSMKLYALTKILSTTIHEAFYL